MVTTTSCNVASLNEYSHTNANPWNRQKVNHLYRRLGFGATSSMIDDALTTTPSALIDNLINDALNLNPTDAPAWGYWTKDDYDAAGMQPFPYREAWKIQMVDDLFENNLRDRLTLFWSNHFVTEDEVVRIPSYVFQYYNILQLHAIGNFKDFVRDIGVTPAMLVYLNGDENTNDRPNENYGRELYELFTLGVDNGYTQNDIVETSRALTGWNEVLEKWGPITFDSSTFDNENKTIFGQTGNWNYNDVIDILFDKRAVQVSQFICRKLYKYFICPEVNEDIVNALANTFRTNNFEIAPVLSQLFKSQHFFDENSYGVIIKSPLDTMICLFKETSFEFSPDYDFYKNVKNTSNNLGQELLQPVDVAGWQGDRQWIDSNTLTQRWDRMKIFIGNAWRHNEAQFGTFAMDLMGGNSNDVELVSKSVMDHFFPKELMNTTEYIEALEVFKDQVPMNYFEDGTWDLNWSTLPKQVYKLLLYIIKVPEFQLK